MQVLPRRQRRHDHRRVAHLGGRERDAGLHARQRARGGESPRVGRSEGLRRSRSDYRRDSTSIRGFPPTARASPSIWQTLTAGSGDVWISDLARKTFTRLSFSGNALSPVWSADGKTIYYVVRRSERPPDDDHAQAGRRQSRRRVTLSRSIHARICRPSSDGWRVRARSTIAYSDQRQVVQARS